MKIMCVVIDVSVVFVAVRGVNVYIVYLFNTIKDFTLVTKDVKPEVEIRATGVCRDNTKQHGVQYFAIIDIT